MYADSVLGLAQAIRDPSISDSTNLSIYDKYYGLAAINGAYSEYQSVTRLNQPSREEMELSRMLEKLHE